VSVDSAARGGRRSAFTPRQRARVSRLGRWLETRARQRIDGCVAVREWSAFVDAISSVATERPADFLRTTGRIFRGRDLDVALVAEYVRILVSHVLTRRNTSGRTLTGLESTADGLFPEYGLRVNYSRQVLLATLSEGLGIQSPGQRLPDAVASLSGMVVIGLMIEDTDRDIVELRLALVDRILERRALLALCLARMYW
jgi:hypothetical protein